MKTAVSIPDPLFKAADEVARRAGLSRSELYAKALAEYVARQRGEWITEQANRVCDEMDTGLDDFARASQARAVPKEEW